MCIWLSSSFQVAKTAYISNHVSHELNIFKSNQSVYMELNFANDSLARWRNNRGILVIHNRVWMDMIWEW